MHSIKITPQEQMRSMQAGREEKRCTDRRPLLIWWTNHPMALRGRERAASTKSKPDSCVAANLGEVTRCAQYAYRFRCGASLPFGKFAIALRQPPLGFLRRLSASLLALPGS